MSENAIFGSLLFAVKFVDFRCVKVFKCASVYVLRGVYGILCIARHVCDTVYFCVSLCLLCVCVLWCLCVLLFLHTWNGVTMSICIFDVFLPSTTGFLFLFVLPMYVVYGIRKVNHAANNQWGRLVLKRMEFEVTSTIILETKLTKTELEDKYGQEELEEQGFRILRPVSPGCVSA